VTPFGPIVWLAADPGVTPTYWWEMLSQYGVLGLVAAALFLFSRGQIKREQERADRLEAQLTQLHATTAEKVVPALVAATQVLADAQEQLRDLARDRGRS